MTGLVYLQIIHKKAVSPLMFLLLGEPILHPSLSLSSIVTDTYVKQSSTGKKLSSLMVVHLLISVFPSKLTSNLVRHLLIIDPIIFTTLSGYLIQV